MTNREATTILNALAMNDPNYEALSTEYAAALFGVSLPDDFAPQVVELLRTDPDAAAAIDTYERNLCGVQVYSLAEVNVCLTLAAALILLLKPHVNFSASWDFKHLKGELKIDTTNASEQTLKTVLSMLSAIVKKARAGLEDVEKALDGKQEGDAK